MIKQRTLKLKELMKSQEMDYMVLIPGANLYYFSGLKMHLSERPSMLFLNADSEDAILLPKIAFPTASPVLKDEYAYYLYSDDEGYDNALKTLVKELDLDGKKTGVASMNMRVMEYELLKRHAPHSSFVDGSPIIDDLRMCKDEKELSFMRQAAGITEKALEATIKMIRPGVTELDILNELKSQMLSLGSGDLFKVLCVISGPRTGNPIGLASNRRIEAGDLVMIDTGATYEGYANDMTRTFAVGNIDQELKNIYEIVKRAQEAVTNFSKKKFTAEELDHVARDIIEQEGYGKYRLHRNGHGIGLEQHEPPYIVKGNKMEMKVGMIFSNEPGMYLPNRGGVRIEDLVVVTSKGLEPLTNFPRELMIL